MYSAYLSQRAYIHHFKKSSFLSRSYRLTQIWNHHSLVLLKTVFFSDFILNFSQCQIFTIRWLLNCDSLSCQNFNPFLSPHLLMNSSWSQLNLSSPSLFAFYKFNYFSPSYCHFFFHVLEMTCQLLSKWLPKVLMFPFELNFPQFSQNHFLISSCR